MDEITNLAYGLVEAELNAKCPKFMRDPALAEQILGKLKGNILAPFGIFCTEENYQRLYDCWKVVPLEKCVPDIHSGYHGNWLHNATVQRYLQEVITDETTTNFGFDVQPK